MPAMNNILSKWIPVFERSRSLALVYSGMYLGSVTGLALSHALIHKFGWPSVFYSFGSLGSIWPNSTQLLTASYDKSVRLWDASNPSYCLQAYNGHTSHVISLDFHPKKNDMFCFCDSDNEIRYWNISPFSCTRVSKQRGNSQVRFQPISGRLLAATSDTVVSIFDVETNMQHHSFQVWHLMLFIRDTTTWLTTYVGI
ncbi:hypothetical protein POM88_011372 [Heracleum sosnowskyi]|uniref:Uncharacterized protein n=1 Tax=Heracleum sosnowskyi TaxID=360622 RepID=A0AAD8IVC1_9APIA|nr:hypothetical protein POM88_011372 [Heracleum sosnowskyi]